MRKEVLEGVAGRLSNGLWRVGWGKGIFEKCRRGGGRMRGV